MGRSIRKIIHVGDDRMLSIKVPSNLGQSVEIILLSCDDDDLLTGERDDHLCEDERFNAAAYAAVIEDDAGEDKVWEACLHAS
ncbi:MAG TPA: hypothetical protein ENI68_00750 [Gammaproteobacteria bacterium]|nr:hypothetical protein [Gammaproteobacteria bacterium]